MIKVGAGPPFRCSVYVDVQDVGPRRAGSDRHVPARVAAPPVRYLTQVGGGFVASVLRDRRFFAWDDRQDWPSVPGARQGSLVRRPLLAAHAASSARNASIWARLISLRRPAFTDLSRPVLSRSCTSSGLMPSRAAVSPGLNARRGSPEAVAEGSSRVMSQIE